MQSTDAQQICTRYGSQFAPPASSDKLGIALATLHLLPLNALRVVPENGTCGWYIWGGEEISTDVDFFQPLHVAHLRDHCPSLVPYLGLAPGWRVFLAPTQVGVWFDPTL